MKLLLDENLSPLTTDFLHSALGHDVQRISVRALGRRLDDEEISELAHREGRFIMTFDLEFGEHFFSCRFTPPGVIVLRLRDQRPEHVNALLPRFFARYPTAEDIQNKLFVVTEGRTRVRRKP